MIVIVDYGLGNSKAIRNILKKIGYQSTISSDISLISNASHLILPGVGNFEKAIGNIKKLNLTDVLDKKVLLDKTPILGICLGMQLMTNRSQEGEVEGLKWINAEVKRFDLKTKKVPHMGWNEIELKQMHNLSFPESSPRFYFVHSYYVKCHETSDIFSTTSYGFDFTSAFKKDNIMGVQFHPEKSHSFGMEILKFFLKSETT
jgi:glutamine amidotransferase